MESDKEITNNIWRAYLEVVEGKKLTDKQKKHMDKDNDGDIDGEDLSALRKEEKTECPKCEGEGCDHCDGKGYHTEEAPADPVKKAPARKGDKSNADPAPKKVAEEAEAEWLADLALKLDELNKADSHTKGATSPEGIADKESPKSKEFMDMHKKSDKEIEDKEEQGHKDVTKVTDKTPTAKDRGGDQLANGDKAILK